MIGESILQLHKGNAVDESIKGDVLKADNTRYADADLIALTNNRLMHLFSSLKLTLAGQMVKHVNNPGQATSLPGLATYSPDYSKGCGLIQGWTPGINASSAVANTGFAIRQRFLIQSPGTKGSFQCAIPMKHIFGFMDDYTKVTYRMRDTLHLIRKGDNDALFRTNAAGAGKVVSSKLAWVEPIVQPNDVLKVNLYKSIAANTTIPVGFRRRQCETFTLPQERSTVWRSGVSSAPEKPRCVLVELQTDKSGKQERNASIFDHCNLTSMQVCLNHFRYPTADMATEFVKEQYVGVYNSFYYGVDNLLACSQVNYVAYKSLYPIHVFEVSMQSERLTEGVVDHTVNMEFSANVPANTQQAYALVISDRMLKFKSDGSKMSVIF